MCRISQVEGEIDSLEQRELLRPQMHPEPRFEVIARIGRVRRPFSTSIQSRPELRSVALLELPCENCGPRHSHFLHRENAVRDRIARNDDAAEADLRFALDERSSLAALAALRYLGIASIVFASACSWLVRCDASGSNDGDITMKRENEHGHVDSKLDALVRSLVRWRMVFLILTVVLPAGCYGVFEPHARRLDVLAATGATTQATVTGLTKQGSDTFVDYSYRVGSETHTWSVDVRNAPHANVGESFPILYSPSDPSLNVIGTERATAAEKAASNRRFSTRLVAALFAILALSAIVTDVRLRRLRKSGLPEVTSPEAFRRRMAVLGIVVVVPCVGVSYFHFNAAQERGEPAWPVALAMLVMLAVLGGTILFALRDSPARAAARSTRALKWLIPLMVVLAVVRALAWQLGR